MKWQLMDEQRSFVGGGNWLWSAHAVQYSEDRDVAPCNYVTLVIGCGYANVYDGHLSIDEICDELPDPIASVSFDDMEWRWDEDGNIEDGCGEKYWAEDGLPETPYNFYCDALADYSWPMEMMWHWYKFDQMQH